MTFLFGKDKVRDCGDVDVFLSEKLSVLIKNNKSIKNIAITEINLLSDFDADADTDTDTDADLDVDSDVDAGVVFRI